MNWIDWMEYAVPGIVFVVVSLLMWRERRRDEANLRHVHDLMMESHAKLAQFDAAVKRTRDVLKQAGHPLIYTEATKHLAANGDMYFDTKLQQVQIYANGKWHRLVTDSTIDCSFAESGVERDDRAPAVALLESSGYVIPSDAEDLA